MKARTLCALTLAASLALAGSARAADNPKGYKDPKVATSWGYLLPGAGHIYAGESGKGWLLMATSVGALATGTVMTLQSGDEDAEVGDDFDFSVGETDWTPSYVGLGIYTLGWVYSVVDAGKAAERTNKKRGLGLLPGRAMPYVSFRDGSPECGVRFRVAL